MKPLQIKEWRTRLNLRRHAMAKYLGVPVYTYIKWENGTRAPGGATERLFSVLQMVQTMAPGIHRQLINEAMSDES